MIILGGRSRHITSEVLQIFLEVGKWFQDLVLLGVEDDVVDEEGGEHDGHHLVLVDLCQELVVAHLEVLHGPVPGHLLVIQPQHAVQMGLSKLSIRAAVQEIPEVSKNRELYIIPIIFR